MKLLNVIANIWIWWFMRAANSMLSECLLRDHPYGEEKIYTQIVKSLCTITLKVANLLLVLILGGPGLGWFMLQVEADSGWVLSRVGAAYLVCLIWGGLNMGWAGDIRGCWLVKPVSSSRSHLVVLSPLFVWSVGFTPVSFTACCHRMLFGGHYRCLLLCFMLGIFFNPGDIRKDWLGGMSFRCSPVCTCTPMPETKLGCRNPVTIANPSCRWGGVLGWVINWIPSLLFCYSGINLRGCRSVTARAIGGCNGRTLWSYECWIHINRDLACCLQQWNYVSHRVFKLGRRGIIVNGHHEFLNADKGILNGRNKLSRFGSNKVMVWSKQCRDCKWLDVLFGPPRLLCDLMGYSADVRWKRNLLHICCYKCRGSLVIYTDITISWVLQFCQSWYTCDCSRHGNYVHIRDDKRLVQARSNCFAGARGNFVFMSGGRRVPVKNSVWILQDRGRCLAEVYCFLLLLFAVAAALKWKAYTGVNQSRKNCYVMLLLWPTDTDNIGTDWRSAIRSSLDVWFAAQHTGHVMSLLLVTLMKIKALLWLFWGLESPLSGYVAFITEWTFGLIGEDLEHQCMGWGYFKVKIKVDTRDTDFCRPPLVYGPPCVYYRSNMRIVNHCKARVLCIPSVGLMVSYFWSPEHVLGDERGVCPP
ncbi:hypothetical protein Hanom_Chr15g01337121 [Helianthus anomalus]